jgi:hypothetical protein
MNSAASVSAVPVHALVVPAAGEDAARVLVDDQDFAVENDVVLVPLKEFLGLDGVVQEADEGGVGRLVQVVDAEVVLHLFDAGLEDAHRALLFIDLVVGLGLEAQHHLGELAVPAVGVALGGTGDDERRAGLIDQDGVHFVDDGIVVAALDQLGLVPRHVVAQVVEAEFVVGAVGDVGRILLAADRGILVREDYTAGKTQEAVDAAHEVGLVFGQVVVDGDDMHAVAGKGVEVGRSGGHQGLAFTGLHLGDVAQVQGGTAHQLDIEVAQAERAGGGFTDGGERLGQEVVQLLAVEVARAEPVGLFAQFGVGECLEGAFQGINGVGIVPQLPQGFFVTRAEKFFNK